MSSTNGQVIFTFSVSTSMSPPQAIGPSLVSNFEQVFYLLYPSQFLENLKFFNILSLEFSGLDPRVLLYPNPNIAFGLKVLQKIWWYK